MQQRLHFLLGSVTVKVVGFFMSLPSATLALLASLLLTGCATKEDQITPAEAALEKKERVTPGLARWH
jgi:hypothetical protein